MWEGFGVNYSHTLYCKNAKAVWKLTKSTGFVFEKHYVKFVDFLDWMGRYHSRAQVELFVVTCWSIWNRRNAKVHSNVVKEDGFLIDTVLNTLSEFTKAIVKENVIARTSCCWNPTQNSIKINVDGVVSIKHNHSAIGMVIREWKGNL